MSDIAFTKVSLHPAFESLQFMGLDSQVTLVIFGVVMIGFCVLVLRELAEHQGREASRRAYRRKKDLMDRGPSAVRASHQLLSAGPVPRRR